VKGRDWYDFAWYAAQGIYPNLPHLEAALRQNGPWSEKKELNVDKDWLKAKLTDRIQEIDWEDAKKDVSPFLRPIEAESLKLWTNGFFDFKLAKVLGNAPKS